jgi:hypothetical protein
MSPRIGILSRGDPESPVPTRENRGRLYRIYEELEVLGAQTEPVIFSEEELDAVRRQLLSLNGVLVWVDPVVAGRNRAVLDDLLREVAQQSVFVSAHPDIILKLGTKEVLVYTRDMDCGTETHLYKTIGDLAALLPRLRDGPRVLKQLRGNGGNGVWKVRLLTDGSSSAEATVAVLHALRGSSLETMTLEEMFHRFEQYFASGGCVIDQPYQDRLAEGMVRCYMTHDRVVGFGHQFVTALLDPPEGRLAVPAPPPRLYYGPDRSEFQALKERLESAWIPEMQRLLDIDTSALPVIWDADFLLGPRTDTGEDTYVLCEINVSSVFPIPEEAPAHLAKATLDLLGTR